MGTLDHDRPLIADPTQAVFVLELASQNGERISIVVRIQSLIENLCSMSTGVRGPWDEWKRSAVIMKVPQCGSSDGDSQPVVQGVHVALVELCAPPVGEFHRCFYLPIFDFSRRGCNTLPLLEGDGAERWALFENGRDVHMASGGWNSRMEIWLIGRRQLHVSCELFPPSEKWR